jgi:hypothetical protein
MRLYLQRWVAHSMGRCGKAHVESARSTLHVFTSLDGLDESLMAGRPWLGTGMDPHAEQYTYRANTGFCLATPTQLSLSQQFQVQIGARYEF